MVSVSFIVLSTVSLTLNTLAYFHEKDEDGHLVDNEALERIEAACIGWFSLEYVLRLWACPSKVYKMFFLHILVAFGGMKCGI